MAEAQKKTLGLCMIVKDEVEDVVRIVKNYGEFFDKIFLTVTHKSQLAKFNELHQFFTVPIDISYFEWTNKFDEARNFNFSKADTDYVFWIDSDDDIAHPERIRNVIDSYPDADTIHIPYLYSFDESGNCNMQHYRERIIKNKKLLTWKGRVHETLIPIEEVTLLQGKIDDVWIVHRATLKDNDESIKRNIKILLQEFKDDGENTDPRTLSYLATSLASIGRHDEAIRFYQEHIKKSGWPEDVYVSWNGIINSLRALFVDNGNKELLTTAISAGLEAMMLFPDYPDAYLNIGECYWYLKEWDKAIEWTNSGINKKIPKTLPSVDPSRYSIRPLPILAYSYLNKGDIEKAYGYMAEAKKRAPKDSFIVDNFPFFEETLKSHEFYKSIIKIAGFLENNDKLKAKNIIDIIPDKFAGDDRYISLRNRYKTPDVWDEKAIAIYCGYTAGEWAPPSVASGIGGSEEAVIYLSQELKKLGYSVVVYNSCGDLEGTYDGIVYKNYWHFNKNDVFSTIISWRGNIFKNNIHGKRKIVWLHDVPFKNDWVKEDYEKVDKIIVLSEYHKELLSKMVPVEKIYVSTNGINIADFIKVDKKQIKREPHRIIYGSSYNRGLEHLLDMWPSIREEIPDAELHIFYGWETYDEFHANDLGAQKWKALMIEKMKQPGITEHGRIGHRQLLEEYAKANVWAYPTFFKEINCITGLKAQASGAIPVYHNQFALKDTVHFGYGIQCPEGEKNDVILADFRKALINALKHEEHAFRDEMKEEIRFAYSWENVAKDWDKNLLCQNIQASQLSSQPSLEQTSNSAPQLSASA